MGWLVATAAFGLLLICNGADGGAVYETSKPIFANPDAYKITFTPITPPNNPATIRAGHSPYDQTTLQMRDVTIEPCGVIAMHIHPRGTEQGYVIKGAIEFGMFLENGTRVYVTPVAGEGVVVPQGTVHYARNTVCETSHIVVVFDHPDPAVVYVGQALVGLPNAILNAAFVGSFPAATEGNQFYVPPPACRCDNDD